MEKPEISEKAKEQYLDASVTVFMEQYAALLHGDAELAEGDFPEELDVRCRKLIEREKEKRSRKRMRAVLWVYAAGRPFLHWSCWAWALRCF